MPHCATQLVFEGMYGWSEDAVSSPPAEAAPARPPRCPRATFATEELEPTTRAVLAASLERVTTHHDTTPAKVNPPANVTCDAEVPEAYVTPEEHEGEIPAVPGESVATVRLTGDVMCRPRPLPST